MKNEQIQMQNNEQFQHMKIKRDKKKHGHETRKTTKHEQMQEHAK
jgi:hypothetical protein